MDNLLIILSIPPLGLLYQQSCGTYDNCSHPRLQSGSRRWSSTRHRVSTSYPWPRMMVHCFMQLWMDGWFGAYKSLPYYAAIFFETACPSVFLETLTNPFHRTLEVPSAEVFRRVLQRTSAGHNGPEEGCFVPRLYRDRNDLMEHFLKSVSKNQGKGETSQAQGVLG